MSRWIDADALEEILEKVPAADIRNMGGQAYVLVKLSQVFNAIDNQPTIEERKTGRWIETEGLDEEIRCTMCTNPMRSDRGCDGSCQYDEKLYKRIMSIIKDRIDGGGT